MLSLSIGAPSVLKNWKLANSCGSGIFSWTILKFKLLSTSGLTRSTCANLLLGVPLTIIRPPGLVTRAASGRKSSMFLLLPSGMNGLKVVTLSTLLLGINESPSDNILALTPCSAMISTLIAPGTWELRPPNKSSVVLPCPENRLPALSAVKRPLFGPIIESEAIHFLDVIFSDKYWV